MDVQYKATPQNYILRAYKILRQSETLVFWFQTAKPTSLLTKKVSAIRWALDPTLQTNKIALNAHLSSARCFTNLHLIL
jgi:hypothetical protein